MVFTEKILHRDQHPMIILGFLRVGSIDRQSRRQDVFCINAQFCKLLFIQPRQKNGLIFVDSTKPLNYEQLHRMYTLAKISSFDCIYFEAPLRRVCCDLHQNL